MNKKIYIGIYLASLAVLLLVGVPALSLAVYENFSIRLVQNLGMKTGDGMILIYLLAFLPILQFGMVHFILNLLILARMWGAIQDGQTKITVLQAVGLLFIPVLHFFWLLFAWGWFPTEYNKFIDRHKLNIPHRSRFMFVIYAVLQQIAIFFFVPWLRILILGPIFNNTLGLVITIIVNLPFILLPIVFVTLMVRICNSVKALENAGVEKRQMPSISPQLPQIATLQAN